MAEVTIVVCDVCGKMDRHTTRYQIAQGKGSTHYDLCAEHAQPVEEIRSTKSANPSPRIFADHTASVEEIRKRKNERAVRGVRQQPLG